MKTTKVSVRIWLSAILTVAIALALVLVVTLDANINSRTGARLRRDADRIARLAATSQSQTVRSAQQMLFALALQPEIRAENDAGSDRVFARILHRYPEYTNVGLIDRSGRLVASGTRPAGSVNLVARSYLREALSSKGASAGGYLVGRVSGRSSIVVAHPVTGTDERPVGVVYAAIDLAWLNRRANVGVSFLPEGSRLLMADRDGRVLAESPGASMIGKTLPSGLLELVRKPGTAVAIDRAFDGVRRVYAAATLTGTIAPHRELHVVVGIREAAVVGGTRRLFLVSLIALAAAFAFGISLIWAGVGLIVTTPPRSLLEAAAARYRRIVEDAPNGVLEVDSERRMQFLNRSMAEMVGYSRDELIGREIETILDPGELDDQRQHAELRRQGKGSRYLRKLRRRDGATRWTLVSGSPFNDEHGDFGGSFGTFTDVTERTEIESRLRESEERFRSFVQEAPEAFFVTDEQGRLIEFNPAAERLTGIGREWAIGRGVWEMQERLLAPERRTVERMEAMRTLVLESLATGEGPLVRRELEGVLTLPDGTRRNFQQLVFPIRTSRGYRLGGAAVDTTGRVATEERLRQSLEQLMEARKTDAIARLAGGVAHDFNNMLTAIMGFGNILSAKLQSNPQLLGYINNVMTSARRAARLTQSLLALGRSGKGGATVVDIAETVQRHRELLPAVVGEDIDLDLQIEGTTTVSIDPADVDQILMNLVTNARDALPEGGSIVIGARGETVFPESPLAMMRPGRYAHLWVADNGTGMEESVRTKAFDPFFTTKDTGSGTGLGLAIVRSIVEQRDGTVRIDTEPGRGTTVHLYLPVAEQTTGTVGAEKEDPNRGNETILVAESDGAVRELVASILRGYGYAAVAAANGAETIEQVRQKAAEINLVLLDVVILRQSGPEVFAELRSALPSVPVVFMSGYASEVHAEMGVRNRDDRVLLKPFSAREVATTVRQALDADWHDDRAQ